MSAAVEDTCPHGVNKRGWLFRDELRPETQVRHVAILSNEACPGCLQERIANLRGVVELLLHSTEPRDRAMHDRALTAYYHELCDWSGPDVPNHLRVTPLPFALRPIEMPMPPPPRKVNP